MTMSRKKLLKAKNDPDCLGINYRIPWKMLVKKDYKKLSDLLTSPGYDDLDCNTHINIQKILDQYPDPHERLN